MDYFTGTVLIMAFFMIIIHCVETLAYAVRISGARVRLIASALSLFNIMVLVSRTSNMIVQPVSGNFTDGAHTAETLAHAENQFRIVIGATTIGTLIGALLLPTFIAIFSRAIIYLAHEGGSVPALVKRGLSFTYMRRVRNHLAFPSRSYIKGIQYKDIPKRLFLTNMLITAVYTVGVLAALYASLRVPEYGTTAVMSSGMINGIATILMVVFVDPKVSVLADNVVNKRGSYLDLRTTTVMMVGSRLCGTLLAQLLFIPGSLYIAYFSQGLAAFLELFK
ncbi:DUF2837 family protein [Bacillus sp. JCM 19041]|uniref:lipid II flippase Amj family protein n=1 Tax=Bacillus sp. JCM 19041 TaxID=1460637 RepID=UPI000ACC3909